MPGGSVDGRLARLGFSDIAAVGRDWELLALGDDRLLELTALAADPDLAMRSLARLVSAAGSEAAPLRRALVDDEEFSRRLTQVLGASSALGDYLVGHPENWRQLADPSLRWIKPTADSLFRQLAQSTSRDELRRTYHRLLLRLAARDLSLDLRVDDAAAELADLATGAVEAALSMARTEVGAPAQLCRLAVIGMGKCGGRELNYVSDVDVIFVAEPTDGADENQAMRAAVRVAAAMMRICSDHTREGTLWPVDAALRPEGKSGPLVRTVSSHASYYQRWAKTWEFQALLKARPIAGDETVGAAYMSAIAPLVWAAADRSDFVPEVQAMRRRIVDNIPAKELDRELKLGPGGLRDIEFAVQLLQMVHGRSDPEVRSRNTLRALEQLTAAGYVAREDGASLAQAYRFLRVLEHRLQLSQMRRTHLLPDNDDALRVLGRSIGLMVDSAQVLRAQWRRVSFTVRRLHEKLFYRPLLGAVAALPSSEVRLTTQAARQRLEALGFADPVAALRHLEALTSGVTRRASIQRQLLPVMLGWFAEAADPDAGLLGFRQLSDSLGGSHWYLRMLRDESASAERLAHLLATSRYAADLLMRAPEATGLLPYDEKLRPLDAATLVHEATAAALRQDDPVTATGTVRGMRRRELFRVAAADIFRLVDVSTVGRALSDVAQATLEGGLAAAQAAIAAEQRRDELPTRFAVIALGRLGGAEMSYASDADVLFVHDPLPGANEQDASEVAFAVANELRRLLAIPGPDPAMALDAGLRPEGRQGPLVRTLASYGAYYRRWSKVWEAQALLRARPIAGDAELGKAFIELIDPLRYPRKGLTPAEITEVRRIKGRVDAERLPRGADPNTHLKLGRGGLADVEWTAQLLQMRFAGQHPELRTTRTQEALEAGVDAGLLDAGKAAALARSWQFASRIRNASMLVRGRPSDSLPTLTRDRIGVAFLCGYDTSDSGRLAEDYLRIARRASAAVQDIFWT